jgi:hypothetical protein
MANHAEARASGRPEVPAACWAADRDAGARGTVPPAIAFLTCFQPTGGVLPAFCVLA